MNKNPTAHERVADNGFVSPDPGSATAQVEAGFFARLDEMMHSSAALFPEGGVKALVLERLESVADRLAHLVANDMDRANIRYVALAVAAFDVLAPVCTEPKAAAIVDDCLNTPMRPWVLEGTRVMLDEAEDPFAAMVAASKEREASYFGPSFTFERPVDDDASYVLEIRRCLYHEALKAADRVRLQPILCRFDLNWVDAIDPERHGQRFVRPVTYASGELCRMCFLRVERLSGLLSTPTCDDGKAQH